MKRAYIHFDVSACTEIWTVDVPVEWTHEDLLDNWHELEPINIQHEPGNMELYNVEIDQPELDYKLEDPV